MINNIAFEVTVDLSLYYTFTGGGGWLVAGSINTKANLSLRLGFDRVLWAELGNN